MHIRFSGWMLFKVEFNRLRSLIRLNESFKTSRLSEGVKEHCLSQYKIYTYKIGNKHHFPFLGGRNYVDKAQK